MGYRFMRRGSLVYNLPRKREIGTRGHHHRLAPSERERHWVIALGIVAAAAAVAAAGVATYSAVQQSEQQAKLAKSVQRQKEQDAQTVRDTAAFEETQNRRRLAILAGTQEANLAASGIDTSSGSALFYQIDLAKQSEMQNLAIRRGGVIDASGKLFESRIAKYQGAVARGAIPYEIAGGTLSAAASGASAYASTTTSLRRKPTATTDWYVG